MPANTKTLTARQTRRLIEKLQLKVGTMIKITVEQALNSKQALKYLNEAHVFEQGQAIRVASPTFMKTVRSRLSLLVARKRTASALTAASSSAR